MIAIIDYGVGNLFSLAGSLRVLEAETVITRDPGEIERADKIILPGVGAFGDAAEKLRVSGLDAVIKNQASSGKPLLGICLGMQLLFQRSFEYGEHKGLGLIEGEVRGIADDISRPLKVPHIGWNSLKFIRPDDPLLKYNKNGDYFYFVHSYYAKNCENSLVAVAEYDIDIPALVHSGSVWGAQFHPEKSGDAGLKMLRAFCEM